MLLEDASKQIFGWDNKLFVTVKYLISKPEVLLKEYLSGTRKKFVNPLAFITIGAAISVLFFNMFSAEYMAMATSFSQEDGSSLGYQVGHELGSAMNKDQKKDSIPTLSPAPIDSSLTTEADTAQKRVAQKTNPSQKFNVLAQKTILKYYNIFTYLSLPIYALIAFWVFGKPYNYAEHLVIACFLQGFSFLTGTICFLGSVFIDPNFMTLGVIISAIIYSYAYGRLYEHSFGKVILKFLRFLLILLATGLVFVIVISLIVFVLVKMGFKPPEF